MRFNVGDKIWTVSFTLADKKTGEIENAPFFYNPDPSMFDIKDIKFILLTISKHHRVPGDFSDKIEYDGFQAVDTNGDIWNNQYPRASYGQLDDSANWHFELAKMKDYFSDSSKGNDGYHEIMERVLKENYAVNGALLTKVLQDLNGGLINDKDQTKMEANHPDIAKELKSIADRIVSEFEKQTGSKLVCYNRNFGKTYAFVRSWKVEQ